MIWVPQRGMGYFPCDPTHAPYNEEYFAKYKSYEDTEVGRALNNFRVDFTNGCFGEGTVVVDVGIGSGTFVQSRPNTLGFDVNPAGVEWLKAQSLYSDPYDGCDYATFWDSLEHIPQPSSILQCIRKALIVSIPIFRNSEHAISSKHFRKDEHYWYFTREGLVNFMKAHNFEVKAHSCMESIIGREDIETFYFKRAN